MDKWAGPVAEISLERDEISLTGMEISLYKTHKRTSPVVGMKVHRHSYKHKRNSSRLPGYLAKRGWRYHTPPLTHSHYGPA